MRGSVAMPRRSHSAWLLALLTLLVIGSRLRAEISSGRIKGEDEPHLVSWRVLEGITEPFETTQQQSVPAWRHMKNAADQKAASLNIQQALHEYGQLLRHPYMFGEMPAEERYDVFLSMAKLLKTMGFHQRAELLLYEAMSHTTNSFEAHMQLGLIFLEKEDLEQAKMQFKNCLFFQESDVSILAHLSVILLVEGRVHEAKFFLSRIISGLETRVRKLSFLMSEQEIQAIMGPIPHPALTTWVEDVIVKVLYGEFHVTPSTTIELLRYFSNLYQWVSAGELTGRFLFDLGQSLYEGGRPRIGRLMMTRGFLSSDPAVEGAVSTEVVRLRLTFDYPLVPASTLDVIESYLNLTTYLSETTSRYTPMDIENSLDIYWPLPLLGFSALPMTSVLRELMWRFSRDPQWSLPPRPWLDPRQHEALLARSVASRDVAVLRMPSQGQAVGQGRGRDRRKRELSRQGIEPAVGEEADALLGHYLDLKEQFERDRAGSGGAVLVPPGRQLGPPVVRLGILGGHMNGHAVGQAVLWNVLSMLEDRAQQATDFCVADRDSWRRHLHITLLSLPLVNDATTKRIANLVDRVVSLPADPRQAMRALEGVQLDVLLFPDWQPFPDQQAVMLQHLRLAPVQICFFVRGTSCASDSVDYYLLPQDQQNFYLRAVPPTSSDAKRSVRATKAGGAPTVPHRPHRPAWREVFAEQVVLLDWPLLTEAALRQVPQLAQNDDVTTQSRRSPAEGPDSLAFMSLESEGRIFFDGQPVAVLPYDPAYLHPLMDDVLFKLMRALPALQVVLALPQSFFAHAQDAKHQTSWARKLARRLWTKGGNLYHRIRSLPFPLSDQRLLQLLRQADLVLDSFPLGAPPHLLALALSTGTPVLTMQPGTTVPTSKDDLHEVRHLLSQPRGLRFRDHPLRSLAGHSDLPWLPASSAVAGFLRKIGLGERLVANSSAAYFQLAQQLLGNRELGYETRVRVLDAIDGSCEANSAPEAASPTCCQGDDLARFLYRVGLPWASARNPPLTPAQTSSAGQPKKLSREDLDASYLEYLATLEESGLGVIQ